MRQAAKAREWGEMRGSEGRRKPQTKFSLWLAGWLAGWLIILKNGEHTKSKTK